MILALGAGPLKAFGLLTEIVKARRFSLSLPVITAIGHETDTTVADLVGDLRAQQPQRLEMAAEELSKVYLKLEESGHVWLRSHAKPDST